MGEGDVHAAPYNVWQPSRQYSGVDPHQPFLQHDTAKCEEDGGVIQALRHVGSDMGRTHTFDMAGADSCGARCVWVRGE